MGGRRTIPPVPAGGVLHKRSGIETSAITALRVHSSTPFGALAKNPPSTSACSAGISGTSICASQQDRGIGGMAGFSGRQQ
jgi:hypothetical protein